MINLLIAFVGQSMAYHFIAFDDVDASSQTLEDTSTLHTKTYPQTENSSLVKPQQTPPQSNKLDNSIDGTGFKASDEVDDCCDVDCCDGECFCPANACSSMIFIDNTLAQSKFIFNSESVLSFVQASPQYIVTSLYRPPIFTS
ncbi:hypothetical protein [Paraglaciecola arctica]|uniref:hypothetical protein n=1 Tax=Paraglaciecola arctica TaxID=1128911 RepID=UPI001C068FB4|nr:hypothetical protein [Paraglaciecola arctica]MBU3003640.1 hypothetical protein [Paraglaciecola arctica]